MKRSHLALLILGVIAFHGVGFWLISGTNPLPKVRSIPRPEFVGKEATFTDEETGRKMVYREFQVSTKLAFPDALMERKEP